VVLAHLTQLPPDPRNVAPERRIPKPLVDLVLKALAKETKDRFQDADQFSAELAHALTQIEDRTSSRIPSGLTVRCGSCGALNAPSQKFCGECVNGDRSAAVGGAGMVAPLRGSGWAGEYADGACGGQDADRVAPCIRGS
jgi:hypothetical protein